MTTPDGLRYIDSDGHILEHPTAMVDYAPAEYRDRIWHVETDADGKEWQCFDVTRRPAVGLSGTAGFSDEDVAKVLRGEIQYSQVRPAAWDAEARLADMDLDHIDLAVLYPTSLLGLQSNLDVDFGTAQARAYNDWCADHVQQGHGRLYGAGALPPMHHPDDVEGVAREIYRVAELPRMVSVFMRPNPAVEWKQFNDPVYDPIWAAAQDTGLPIGLHPFLAPDLPGVCQGLRLGELPSAQSDMASPNYGEANAEDATGSGRRMGNIYFTQAISNPFDVMSSLCFLTSGGVCERYPGLKLIFLEANGGWLVPWLERLDHHTRKFPWDVPWLKMLPSEYFRRQCWISFDPDEAMLSTTALSPLVGADRIIWASDYPHPDAKFPGVTEELAEAMASLSAEQRRQIASETAIALYGIG
jgi:predicted TIM-barrel fold metal-dependent hydrolase